MSWCSSTIDKSDTPALKGCTVTFAVSPTQMARRRKKNWIDCISINLALTCKTGWLHNTFPPTWKHFSPARCRINFLCCFPGVSASTAECVRDSFEDEYGNKGFELVWLSLLCVSLPPWTFVLMSLSAAEGPFGLITGFESRRFTLERVICFVSVFLLQCHTGLCTFRSSGS